LALALVGVAQAGEPGTSTYALRLTLVWVCAAVAAAAYAVTVYGLAVTAPARPASRRAELLWAIIPATILIALALPAVERLAKRAAGAEAAAAIATSAIDR
jgi:heme/copper-type cytochrome/quinol oxidase subunit 2